MKTHDVLLLLPFEEWDVKASTAMKAVDFVTENDMPLQHKDTLHHFVTQEIKDGFRVFLLTPLAGNRIEGAVDDLDAYNKSSIRSFIRKGVPYAISVNNKILITAI